MLNAKLVVVGGDVKTTEVKLRLPCVIGRGKGSTLTLGHPLVSRQHCELFEASGRLWVRDLGSLNGTYVNNEKIGEAELPPGELLTVGSVTFRAAYEPLDDTSPPNGTRATVVSIPAGRSDESQPTVRVDASASVEEPVGEFEDFEEVEPEPVEDISPELIEDFEEVEDEGMPHTPLFSDAPAPSKSVSSTEKDKTRPAPMAVPVVKSPPQPAVTVVTTTDATAETEMESDPASANVSGDEAGDDEAPEGDDDLNDFLRSLGKK